MKNKIFIAIAVLCGITLIGLLGYGLYQALQPKEFNAGAYSPFTPNKISTLNATTTTTLVAGGTYQGTGEDVSKYGRVGIAIHSDNATDGTLTIEVSHDDVTYFGPTRDWANTSIAVPHMWNIVEKYFRIKYVNGTTAATNLSIQVQYSTNADIVLSHQLSKTLAAETEAQVVRPGNSFDLDAARKHITGQRSFFFFGFNDAVGNAAFEDVWPFSGDIPWLKTATTVEIFSSHADDDITGLGTRSVEIHGLSLTGEDQDEVVELDGTVHVFSTKKYIRLNKAHNEEVGTYGGSHRGDITFESKCDGCTGTAMSMMTGVEGNAGDSVQYGSGEAGNGYWSVPLGKVMYITRLEVIPDVATNKFVDIVLYEREGILTTTTAPFLPRRVIWQERSVDSSIEKEFKSHIKIKGLTDIWFRAKSTSGSSLIEVFLDFYLVDADASGA